jgi:pullulanase
MAMALVPWAAKASPAPPPIAARAAAIGDCDAPGHAWMLAPAAGDARDARAYWLDRQRLQWPGAASGGRFRLYHSADARLAAPRGAHVAGADGALTLVADPPRAGRPRPARFRFLAPGPRLAVAAGDHDKLPDLLRQQMLLVHEDAAGRVLDATHVQLPGALDDWYAAARTGPALGATVGDGATTFRLWAPTARSVSLCVYRDGTGPAVAQLPLWRDTETGNWWLRQADPLPGDYYAYLVDVYVPGMGIVRNRVTDPYSMSLTADSTRSHAVDPEDPALKPAGWDHAPRPAPLAATTDMVIYELHVRDFSRDDASVSAGRRGKYLAFTERDSAGMRHLRALADAGLSDVHLLPVFDLATVPETGCVEPAVPAAAADSDAQQAAVMAVAGEDCFNWGYDPFHFNAPEGSYASTAADGAARVRELRAMVQALHAIGLRVGMDVVYNHTTASGQAPRSVLDRIVPGYYHRLDANGTVERSTCCDNTATEHAMMERLMIDSAEWWVRHYRIDSFRFDLMGHQPRAAMQRLQARVDAAAGRRVELIGEGWNFGEVADGARFVQASQASLRGSGIGSFSDRARDAIRGGGPADSADALFAQGYVNGLHYAPNGRGHDSGRDALMHAADLVRTGLAGTLAGYVATDRHGRQVPQAAIDYKGQAAGYATEPGEVVNYVENHDNQTLFDINVLKLPTGTERAERARVQLLALALNALSQGIAYFHAGGELLRSKSLDRNSYDSGDWFNRIDWSASGNHFGSGLPPAHDNRGDWPLLGPLLADTSIAPRATDIEFVRDGFLDLLRIRDSSTLFRLRTAADVQARLRFPNAGPGQNPVVIAGHLDGRGYAGAAFDEILYMVNVSPASQALDLPELARRPWRLHPVQRAAAAADPRPRDAASHDPDTGRFTVPPRTTVVYVLEPASTAPASPAHARTDSSRPQ